MADDARRWALVTGASSGIGRSIAEQLAARGYHLVLVARDEGRLSDSAASLRERHGVLALPIGCDLGQTGACEELCRKLEERGVEFEIVVNSAGFGVHGQYEEADYEQLAALVQVQILGLMRLTRLVLPPMRRRRRGHILNVASVYSFCAVPEQAVYAASKAFMLSFSRALQAEVNDVGIAVTVVCPGVTRTNFRTRMGHRETSRVSGMSADAVASAAVEGLLARRFLVVPGFGNQFFAWVARCLPAGVAMRWISSFNRKRGLGSSARNDRILVDKIKKQGRSE